MEIFKSDISTIRKENCLQIDNLCNNYSQNNINIWKTQKPKKQRTSKTLEIKPNSNNTVHISFNISF